MRSARRRHARAIATLRRAIGANPATPRGVFLPRTAQIRQGPASAGPLARTVTLSDGRIADVYPSGGRLYAHVERRIADGLPARRTARD